MKILRKIGLVLLSIMLLLFICIAIVVNFILTPNKITPLVVEKVNENINAKFSCSSVELTFFTSFPRFAFKVKNCILTAKELTANDTIASMEKCFASFDIYKYISKKRIDVHDITLEHPIIYLSTDSLGNGNWNILKESTDTNSSENSMNDLLLTNLTLRKLSISHANLRYTDGITKITQQVSDFNLLLKASKNSRGMKLALENSNNNIYLYKNPEKKYTIKKSTVNADFVYTNTDSILAIKKSDVSINNIHFSTGGTIQIFPRKRMMQTNLKATLSTKSLVNIIELIPKVFLNRDEIISTGNIDLTVNINGFYGHGRYPIVTAGLSINNGSLQYQHFPGNVDDFNSEMSARIGINDTTPSYVHIKSFVLKGTGVNMNVSGNIDDVLKNAKVDASVKAKLDLTALQTNFPVNKNIEARGNIESDIDANFKLSDILLKQYANIYINGNASINNVKLVSIPDSLYFSTQKIAAIFSRKKNTYNATAANFQLSNTDFNYKSNITFSGKLLKADLQALQTAEKAGKLHASVEMDAIKVASKRSQLFAELSHAVVNANLFPAADSSGSTLRKQKTDFADFLRKRIMGIDANADFAVSNLKFTAPADSIFLSAANITSHLTNQKKKYNSLTGKINLGNAEIVLKNDISVSVDKMTADIQAARTGQKSIMANASFEMGLTKFKIASQKLAGKLSSGIIKANLYPATETDSAYISSHLIIDSVAITQDKNFVALKQGSYDILLQRKSRKVWMPEGIVEFTRMHVKTPEFPIRMSMAASRLSFKGDDLILDHARIRLGRSTAIFTGHIQHPIGLFNHDKVSASLTLESDFIDANQLMQAFASTNKSAVINADSISVEPDISPADTATAAAKTTFKVPQNLHLDFSTNIKRIKFSTLAMDSVMGELQVTDGIVNLKKISLKTLAANLDANVVYAAKSNKEADLQFQLYLTNIEMSKIHELMTFVDTIFPMAKSFEGKADFRIKGKVKLDDSLNFKLPTLKAIAALKASQIMVLDGPSFRDIAKTFMFKSKEKNHVETLSMEMEMDKNEVIFLPALLEIDRYRLAVGGIQHLDMSYDYHVSVLKSPMPFKTGFEIEGKGTEYRIKLSSAKYKYYFTDKERLAEKADAAIINRREQILKELNFSNTIK